MNLIAGPNGSGKSSIVCAICLGLTGSPGVLGRAKQTKEFIKHGEMEAMVEIKLYDPAGNKTIKTIIRQDGTKWFINGILKTKKEVNELVRSYNIQVNNLCQFLPQDKVVEFARLSREELLKETEKTINPELYIKHEELVKFRAGAEQLEKEIDAKKENLKILESENQVLHLKVQRFREREKHMDKLELLKQRRCWRNFDIAREKYIAYKIKLKEIDNQIKKLSAEHEPQLNHLRELEKKQRSKETDWNRMAEYSRKGQEELKSLKKKVKDDICKGKETIEDFDKRKSDASERESRIQELNNNISSLKEELDKIVSDQELSISIRQKNEQIHQLEARKREMLAKKRTYEIRCEEISDNIKRIDVDLKKATDIKQARLQQVRRTSNDVYQAAMWLEANKNKLKDPSAAFGPMVVELNVSDQEYAKYVEDYISRRDLFAFIFSNKDDMNLFLKEVRDRLNYRVSAVVPDKQSLTTYRPRHDIESLRKYGFRCYLSDQIDAPEVILKYLHSQYRIYDVPIGNEVAQRNAEYVSSKLKVSNFYAYQDHYVCRQSAYGNREISTRITHVRDTTILNRSVDKEEIRRLTEEKSSSEGEFRELTQLIKEIEEGIQPIYSDIAKVQQDKKRLLSQKNRKAIVESKIEGYMNRIAQEESVSFDLEDEKKDLFMKLQKLDQSKVKVLRQIATLAEQHVKQSKERVLISVELLDIKREYRQCSNALTAAKNEYKKLEDLKSQCDRERLDQHRSAMEKFKIAKQSSNLQEKENPSKTLQEQLSSLPNDLEEIEEEIQAEMARLQLNTEQDSSVIERYEKQKSDIKSLTEEIRKSEDRVKQERNKRRDNINRWNAGVERMVSSINEKFKQFFSKLNCVGEVKLRSNENDEFEKYAIEIWVKFRSADKVQLLDSHLQSGGERSVATIIYLISLQEFTVCPFRIVDEINQGMDPYNEKMIFEFVMEVSSKSEVSQYLLITPKLLPDLCYNGELTALFIYNGPYMLEHEKWNINKFIRRKQVQQQKER